MNKQRISLSLEARWADSIFWHRKSPVPYSSGNYLLQSHTRDHLAGRYLMLSNVWKIDYNHFFQGLKIFHILEEEHFFMKLTLYITKEN